MDEKKDQKSINLSNKQCITYLKNSIKSYRSNNEKKNSSLTSLIDSILVYFEIDRVNIMLLIRKELLY